MSCYLSDDFTDEVDYVKILNIESNPGFLSVRLRYDASFLKPVKSFVPWDKIHFSKMNSRANHFSELD